MTTPRLTAVRLGGSPRLPLLVLGPSLGTSAQTLWTGCAPALAEHFEVLAWDLPGHGTNRSVGEPFTVRELALGVLDLVDDMLAERGQTGTAFSYAGVSVGGATGLELLLAAPDRVDSAVLLCTGAAIGTAESWAERVATVRASGTPALVTGSAERWFARGFVDRSPDVASALLHALNEADDEGYAQVCGALSAYDVTARLPEIATPVLAVAGAEDPVCPPESLAVIADGVRDGRLVTVENTSHLAPAERPDEVARLMLEHLAGVRPEPPSADRPAGVRTDPWAAGDEVRRAVLGDAHVDRAASRTSDLTRDFQDLITEYAWGSVWTRPGLDRRTRSVITLTALVAGGHHEELALHLRGARRNGLSDEEILEVLLQTAIYCGVPAANTAFRIAQQVLEEDE